MRKSLKVSMMSVNTGKERKELEVQNLTGKVPKRVSSCRVETSGTDERGEERHLRSPYQWQPQENRNACTHEMPNYSNNHKAF